jgi:hypothetical protein
MNKLHISIFVLFAGLILSGCDKIEAPFVKNTSGTDTTDTNTIVKKVLLEDYTGHTCPNCPSAGKLARDLAEQHSGRLIVMAVHAGWFARVYPESGVPALYDYDFRTVAGTSWNSFFGNDVAGNPNGLVNRMKVNNKYVIKPSEWEGVINSALAQDAIMDISLDVSYNVSNRSISADVTSNFNEASTLNLKLEVVITEDSIIAPQENNDASIGPIGDIDDFVHMHVLRGALNDTWGTLITQAGAQNPKEIATTITGNLPDVCIPKNCHIIAFVFNAETREILQAAEVELLQ